MSELVENHVSVQDSFCSCLIYNFTSLSHLLPFVLLPSLSIIISRPQSMTWLRVVANLSTKYLQELWQNLQFGDGETGRAFVVRLPVIQWWHELEVSCHRPCHAITVNLTCHANSCCWNPNNSLIEVVVLWFLICSGVFQPMSLVKGSCTLMHCLSKAGLENCFE